jgi:predicted cupin superfamily sugar epimerase
MLSAQEIIKSLGLIPHPAEGGFFRETYRSREAIPRAALPARYPADRSFSTAIYYLLTPQTCSRLHRLSSDEIFHFYLGDPITMLLLHPDGRSEEIALGSDIENGLRLQVVVPKGTWQGSFLQYEGRFALLGTTVAPGFDYADYEAGDLKTLVNRYPERTELITRLT